jgi:hypothetical protein
MITSPINPMRYWKLEEIQRMLNRIEGYENVVIEFQYQQSDDWTKRKVWECKCGIKEQLVNGQYSWLLKYVFAIEANDEGDARTIAWQEAAERLVTDVWRTSINSFRKQQRELSGNNQFKIALEKMNKTPMNVVPDSPTPSITKIEETTNKKTNTQTNKTWWTETKLWIVSSIIVMAILLSVVYFTKALLIMCLVILATLFLGLLVAGIYVIIKEVLGLDDE